MLSTPKTTIFNNISSVKKEVKQEQPPELGGHAKRELPSAERESTTWKVADVLQFLDRLELSHVAEKFKMNGIDGPFLQELSEGDLVSEIGLTKLQARKVLTRLP